MKPRTLTQIIDKKRYDTNKAVLLSGDDYWDGQNFERGGRNTFLYKTINGNYFAACLTCRKGESDNLKPLSQDEAIEMFEEHMSYGENRVTFEDAFPFVEVEEA